LDLRKRRDAAKKRLHIFTLHVCRRGWILCRILLVSGLRPKKYENSLFLHRIRFQSVITQILLTVGIFQVFQFHMYSNTHKVSSQWHWYFQFLFFLWVRSQGFAALMHCRLSWAYCARLDLVPPVISRGAPRLTTWETSVSVGGKYGQGNGRFNFA
jgi:hypothetical protein